MKRVRRPIFNLPNCLTLSRFLFAPIMLCLILDMQDPRDDPSAWTTSLWGAAVLLATLATDLFDGSLARARGEVTNFGKIMDPVADSTFFMTLLFGLANSRRFGEHVSLWLPILVLYREVAMQIFRRYAALAGNAVPAKFAGKAKMAIQSAVVAAFFFCVLARDWSFKAGNPLISEEFLQTLSTAAGFVTVAVNLLSLIEYARDVPELMAEYAPPEN